MLTSLYVRRLLKRLQLRWACAPLFVACVFAFAANVFLDEQTLTGDQEAQLLPGNYEASASLLGLSVPIGSPYLTEAQKRLDDEQLPVTMSLQVIDFPAYSLADDGVYLRELNWSEDPFPGVYSVKKGRMPSKPGEVAVAAPDVTELAAVGDRLASLGEADAIEVVGLVQPRLRDDTELLAAPGTLAQLKRGKRGLNAQLSASPTFLFEEVANNALIEDLARTLEHYDPEVFSIPQGTLAEAITQSVRTREAARLDIEKSWTHRSPILFYLPVLILIPLSVLLCLFGLGRQLRPAMRVMAMHGMRRRAVFAVGVGVTAIAASGASIAGAITGAALGHLTAQVDAWSAPAAAWRFPYAATSAVGVGLLVGLTAVAVILARGHRSKEFARGASPSWVRHVRHGLATAAGCYGIVLVPGLNSANEALTLTAVTTTIATLLSPDLLSWLVSRVGEGRLVMRLTKRSMQASASRHATTATVLTLGFCVCAGVLTATATALEVQRQHQSPTALPGQVALDNDDTPFLPVDPAVTLAAETVPALAEQQPAQLYTVGKLVTIPGTDSLDLAKELSLAGSGLVLAFETTGDIERAGGRKLTESERAILSESGVLVIDEATPVSGSRVDLLDEAGQVAVSGVRAQLSEFEPTPWFVAVSSITLTETMREMNQPVSPGAVIYTDVPDADAEAVLKALSDSGISPEQADIHRPPPNLLPPAALSGLSAGLFLVVLLLAVVSVRGQVAMMRPWASRLTQLGVRGAWAKSAIRRQFLLVGVTAVPLGVAAGLGPLLLARSLVPDMPVLVPWEAVGALLAALAAGMTSAAWLSTRSLSAKESLGWAEVSE